MSAATRRPAPPHADGGEMVLVAVAFVIGGVLGAVLTAVLVARGQRGLDLGPVDFESPVRPPEQWLAESAEPQPYSPYSPDAPNARIERFEAELARRLGREAADTARERRAAAARALRPGVSMRVKP